MLHTETHAGDADATLARLKEWLLALERNKGRGDIDVDTDIIDGGVIDSLEFISFLLFIESLRARPIPADEMQLDSFRTLRAIQVNFM